MGSEAIYEDDKPLVSDGAFMAWIAELEKVMADFAEKNDGHPYGAPLVRSTGLACWHDYYTENFSPREAFNEDRTYWEHDDGR